MKIIFFRPLVLVCNEDEMDLRLRRGLKTVLSRCAVNTLPASSFATRTRQRAARGRLARNLCTIPKALHGQTKSKSIPAGIRCVSPQ